VAISGDIVGDTVVDTVVVGAPRADIKDDMDTVTTDQGAAYVFVSFNRQPTDLALSDNRVDENSPSGTIVGTFSATDPDGDTLAFALVEVPGNTDHTAFRIDGSTLLTNTVLDYETQRFYNICVQATDTGGLFVEEVFVIRVDPLTIASFIQKAKLTASDGAKADALGFSVAVSGDTVVVGAHGDDKFKGSAYVFVKSAGGGWAQKAKLTASDGAAGD
jgi:FG-GAP repeat/Cadherin domain